MKSITIHDVSQDEFVSLRSHLESYYDVQFENPKDGVAHVAGRGVSGALQHDSGSRQLRIMIDMVPSIVTPGYVLGFLYDQLHVKQGKD